MTMVSSSSSPPSAPTPPTSKHDARLASLEGSVASLSLAPTQPHAAADDDDGNDSLDETLVDALRSSRDRLFILRQEQDIHDFVAGGKDGEMLLPLMNSYQRLLVHRCADYFHLAHHIDPDTKAVKLVRTPDTRLPRRRMIQMFNQANSTLRPADVSPFVNCASSSDQTMADGARSATASPSPAPPTGFRIMRRDPSLVAVNATASSSSSSTSSAAGKKSRKDMTIEEREASYREARERIFGPGSDNVETTSGDRGDAGAVEEAVQPPVAQPQDEISAPVAQAPPPPPPGMTIEQQQQQQAAWYQWYYYQQQQQLAAAQPYAYLSQQPMWPPPPPPPPFVSYPPTMPHLMPPFAPPMYPWQYTTTAPSPTTPGSAYPVPPPASTSSALSAYNLDAFSPFPPTPSNLSSSGTGSVGLPSPAPSVVSSASSRDGEGSRRATAWQRQQQQHVNGDGVNGSSIGSAADNGMVHRGVPLPPPSAFMPPFDPQARSASSSPISSRSDGARGSARRGISASSSGRLNVGERTLFDPRAVSSSSSSSSSSPALSARASLSEAGRGSSRHAGAASSSAGPTIRIGAVLPAGAVASSSQSRLPHGPAGLPPRPDWAMAPATQRAAPVATEEAPQQTVCGVSTPRTTASSAARPTTAERRGGGARSRSHSVGSANSASTTTNRSEGGKLGADEEDDARSRSSDGSSSLGPSASASNVGGDDLDEDEDEDERGAGD